MGKVTLNIKSSDGETHKVKVDEDFLKMSEEAQKEAVNRIGRELSEIELIDTTALRGQVEAQGTGQVIEGHAKEYIGAGPGAYYGGKAGLAMAPTFAHPVANLISKGGMTLLGGVGGGLASNHVTGPYIDAGFEKMKEGAEEGRKMALTLGDDFGQGIGNPNAVSIIDNSAVPYTSVDSSSTGVLR